MLGNNRIQRRMQGHIQGTDRYSQAGRSGLRRRGWWQVLGGLVVWWICSGTWAVQGQLAAGTGLVVDEEAGALFTVDPSTGNRTLLSDFGDAAQGPVGAAPYDVALTASGTILVTDPAVGTAGRGALFTVDPSTGNRTLLSDFGDGAQGPLGAEPFGVALTADGTILVIDEDAGTGGGGGRCSRWTSARAIARC